MFLAMVFSYIVHFNKNDLAEWLDSLNNEVM